MQIKERLSLRKDISIYKLQVSLNKTNISLKSIKEFTYDKYEMFNLNQKNSIWCANLFYA